MSDEATLFFVGVFIGALIAANIASAVTRNDWKEDAVKHGAAHYDSKTAAFKWNDEP